MALVIFLWNLESKKCKAEQWYKNEKWECLKICGVPRSFCNVQHLCNIVGNNWVLGHQFKKHTPKCQNQIQEHPHQATSLLSTPHREVFPFSLLRFHGGTQPWRLPNQLKKLEVDPLLSGRKNWIFSRFENWKIENQESVCFPAHKSRRSSDDLQNPCNKTPAMSTSRDLILLKTNFPKSPNLEMAWNGVKSPSFGSTLKTCPDSHAWNSNRERPTISDFKSPMASTCLAFVEWVGLSYC